MNTIGFKLRKLRENKKISQQELASDLNIAQSTICKIESGNTDKVDFLLMQKICEYFEINFEYFTEPTQFISVNKNNGGIAGNNFGTIVNEKKSDTNH